MNDNDWREMMVKLLELPDEEYWDATIQKLLVMRSELDLLISTQKPFKTKPLFSSDNSFLPFKPKAMGKFYNED